jgi:PASTA domain-containing protein
MNSTHKNGPKRPPRRSPAIRPMLVSMLTAAAALALSAAPAWAEFGGSVVATLAPAGGNTRVLTITNNSELPLMKFRLLSAANMSNVRSGEVPCLSSAIGAPGVIDFVECKATINPGASVQVCFDGGGSTDIELEGFGIETTAAPAVSGCPLGAGSTMGGGESKMGGGAGSGSVPTPIGASKCLVPNVKGKTVGAAETAITRAHCSLGRLLKAKSKHTKKGRVVSEAPAVGKSLPGGAKVNLVVSRGE